MDPIDSVSHPVTAGTVWVSIGVTELTKTGRADSKRSTSTIATLKLAKRKPMPLGVWRTCNCIALYLMRLTIFHLNLVR